MLNQPVILPMDGYHRASCLLVDATRILSGPNSGMIGMIKINDGVHMPDMSGPHLCAALKKIRSDLGIFLDLKLGDVSGTLKNIASHYLSPDILTVSSMIDAQGLMELRKVFTFTKLALFSVPTDMSEEKCLKRYGKRPAEKIHHDIQCLEEDFQEIRENGMFSSWPFDLVVCSPRELDYLHQAGIHQKYGFICPGIRDKWMSKGQQERTTGVKEALEKGATYVVLGSQMTKGNPAQGVDAEESRRRTVEEIEMEKLEGGGHA